MIQNLEYKKNVNCTCEPMGALKRPPHKQSIFIL